MSTDTEIKLPRVLVCAPQHESKDYAWDRWIENVRNLTYPSESWELFIADNSPNEDYLKERIIPAGAKYKHIKQNKKGLRHTINDAHNSCRDYALKHGFDFMLHLETDIIPPIDVIERLINNNKKVVGGFYDILHGKNRKLMIQVDEHFDRNVKAYRTPEYVNHEEPLILNGKVNQVYHIGLGCVLIHKSVLEMFPFRVLENSDLHSDTWFANDCYLTKTNIYVDTTIECKHYNSSWVGIKLNT